MSVPLGSVVAKVHNLDPKRHFSGSEFTYVDIGAIDQNAKKIRETKRVSASEAPSRARQLLKAGDILISTVRPNLNAVAVVPEELEGSIASTGFCVLRPDPSKTHTAFLFHWVKSKSFVEDMVRKATGASYPAVSDRIIFESVVPLPSIEEQHRIAAILDQAEDLRSKRRAAIALLDQLPQAIFLEMFGDPATNPMDWPNSHRLSDFADLVSGITKGRKLNAQAVREIPYLAVVNVQDKRLDLETIKSIEATESEIARYRLVRNDLLLTEGGDPDKLGRGTLWNDELPEAIHQNHVFRVRLTTDTVNPLYLSWLIGSAYGKAYFLRQAKQTTGIATINMGQLKAFPLLLPPAKLQFQFAESVATINQAKVAHQSALLKLDALFASLQATSFSGGNS